MMSRVFNNSCQLNKQVGSFRGMDACCLRSHGNFSFVSHVLEERESLAIAGRSDTKGLVSQLVETGRMHEDTGRNMLENSHVRFGAEGQHVLNECTRGATHMTHEDCLKLQKELSMVNEINVTVAANHDQSQCVFRPNWLRSIVWIHNNDKHGAQFYTLFKPCIGQPRFGAPRDDRLTWIMAAIFTCSPDVWESLDAAVNHSSDWTGCFLSFLSLNVFKSRGNRSVTDDVFKKGRKWKPHQCLDCFANATTLTQADRTSILHNGCDVIQTHKLFCGMSRGFIRTVEHANIHVDLVTTVQPILSPDLRCFIVTRRGVALRAQCVPQQRIVHQHSSFELRFISISGSKAFARHGRQFSGWWEMNTSGKTPRRKAGDGLPTGIESWDVLVCVVENSRDLTKLRDDHSTHIGGQVQGICSEHKLPLVTAAVRRDQHKLSCSTNNCDRRVRCRCPRDGCEAALCLPCFQDVLDGEKRFVVPVGSENDQEGEDNEDDDEEDKVGDDDEDDDEEQEDEFEDDDDSDDDDNDDENSEDDFDDEDSEDDQHNVCAIRHGNDLHTGSNEPMFDSELFPDAEEHVSDEQEHWGHMPATVASARGPPQVVRDSRSTFLSNTALLSGIGSLLVRQKHRLTNTRQQSEFLEGTVAVQHGKTVPLVYPEAMLFPSIFPFDNGQQGDMLGAIPAPFLSQTKNHLSRNIASVKDHVKMRMEFAGSCASTDFRHQCFLCDCMVNDDLGGKDTRIVMNRGLVPGNCKTGLRLRDKNDTCFSDSIDNRQVVHNLTAAQQCHPMTMFLTFTCNVKLHFGIRKIKDWLDSGLAVKQHDRCDSMSCRE